MSLKSFAPLTLSDELVRLMRRHPQGISIGQASAWLHESYLTVADELWRLAKSKVCRVANGRFYIHVPLSNPA